MKDLLIAIDSKFIHTNLAVRLLKANTTYDVNILEFTIKDNVEKIAQDIIDINPRTICISTYIWNIELIKTLIPILKEQTTAKIILGGPDVSYEFEYLFDDYNIDFIIRNEGEIAYHLLLESLHNNYNLKLVPNIVYKKNGEFIHTNVEEIDNLNILNSPYYFDFDIKNIKNRIQYIETSRGCPFNCSYCMASLEKKVRYKDIERVKEEILYLLEHGARVFKFLDRTFNTKVDYAIDMFDFIIKHYNDNSSFQFEITLDILKPEVIEYLNENAPKNLFRFEVGVQSTNVLTNKLVDRIQDNNKLFNNIDLIHNGEKIDLHLDLIAGLPKEDFDSFERTFNEVFEKRPKELQLGFLKLLKGTKLKSQADVFGYTYSKNAPYELIKNDSLTNNDIQRIHLVEEALEKYWNSGFCINTLDYIFEQYNNPFKLFLHVGTFYSERYSWFKYQLDELFLRFLEASEKYNIPYIQDYLKYDYLIHSKVKPKVWWNDKLDKSEKNSKLRELYEQDKTFTLNELYKYAIVEKFKNKFIVVVYYPNKKTILFLG